MFKTLRKRLRATLRDQQGADMVEYVLVIALIALPLVAAIIIWRKDLWTWVMEKWESVKSDSE